jgi:sulfite reductase (NADPH) hemoprotein beta-component
LTQNLNDNKAFALWFSHNTHAHKKAGYRIVTLSLKKTGVATGDITSEQMEAVADLADKYSFGEVRTTHEQNIVLADVRQEQLFELMATSLCIRLCNRKYWLFNQYYLLPWW